MYARAEKFIILFSLLILGLLFTPLGAVEQGEDIQNKVLTKSGDILDRRIYQVYRDMEPFSYLLNYAKADRLRTYKGQKEPFNTRHDKRQIRHIPWRNAIRYVKESESYLYKGYGTVEEVRGLINKRIQEVRENNIQVGDFKVGNREGIEISEFSFLYYARDPDKTRSIGSRRLILSLFLVPTGKKDHDSRPLYTVESVALRVIRHDFRTEVKDVVMTIDPTPNDVQTRDIIIMHRYNYEPPHIDLLGIKRSNANYNHRNEFKREYVEYLSTQFLQKLQRIDRYNTYTRQDSFPK